MAGSAAIISNACTKLGHPSVVYQDSNIETFEHGKLYKNTFYHDGDLQMLEALKNAIPLYDHIIYHDRYKLALVLDDLHKPSSYIFHGNMLRQNPQAYKNVMNLESIENIFVSTEDLLKYAPEATLFTRPIDLDMFKPILIPNKKPMGLCLTQDRYKPYILELLRGNTTGYFLVDRVANRVQYSDMPKILNSYSYYYDVKYQPTHPPTMIEELSGTALQALACKIPVWSCGKWYNAFPIKHDDERAALEFLKVLKE